MAPRGTARASIPIQTGEIKMKHLILTLVLMALGACTSVPHMTKELKDMVTDTSGYEMDISEACQVSQTLESKEYCKETGLLN